MGSKGTAVRAAQLGDRSPSAEAASWRGGGLGPGGRSLGLGCRPPAPPGLAPGSGQDAVCLSSGGSLQGPLQREARGVGGGRGK